MPDRLHKDIEQAIRQHVDPSSFEYCAVDLLRQNYYSTLRGTPHGRDAGIDGISGPDAEPDLVLVATTAKEFDRNLRNSVKRYVAAGGSCRTVVLATTRKVAVTRRFDLQQELLTRWGTHLHAVHDQGDFVRLLHDSPKWRKELLDVAGVARALSRFPTNSRPTLPIPLIGRDDDLKRLRSASGDLVLVGRPGAGKTFLLEQLASEDWGLFDAGWNVADLEDAVREMQPQRVVIDDAHLTTNRLTEIGWLRRAMDVTFGIVAVSWPGQADVVTGNLAEAVRVDVKELERDQILHVIKEVGIAGPPALQRLIIDQAHGCVGLAVTLARACVTGRIGDVWTGDVLLDDLTRWYGRTLGGESRHALGVLALTGNHGATMEHVREVLGLPLATCSDLIRSLASGGTIDEVPPTFQEVLSGQRSQPGPRMRVQPEALRYALVRDVFFSGPGSLDAAAAIDRLEQPSIAAIPIIGAIHRGADVSHEQLLPLVDWADLRAATEYARLGPSEFRTALDRAPAHRTRIAEAAYKAEIDPRRALEVLMEQAIGDDRAEHSAPDHPLRIVGDHLAGIETKFAARQLAVETGRTWLQRGSDGDVGIRVLMHAVYPGVHSVSTDPGLGNTLTFSKGVVPRSWIDNLSDLWGEIIGIFEREQPLPPAPLFEGLGSWVHPNQISFGRGLDEETAAAIRIVATHVIERLSDVFRTRPGVLARLRGYAKPGELPVQIDVPHEFATLFPEDWPVPEKDIGFEDWMLGVDAQVSRLAESLQKRSSDDIAVLITEADAEAKAAGITYPRHTPRLAQILAGNTEEPETLLNALTRHGASPDIVFPFLDRTVELQRPGWETQLEHQLAETDTSGTAVQIALTRPCGNRLKRLAIEKAVTCLHVVKWLFIRDEIDHATLALLFDAPDLSVRRKAAVTLGTRQSGNRLAGLPAHLIAQWRQIIIESPADDWESLEILKRDHELCADWLRDRFGRLRKPDRYEFVEPGVADTIAAMPSEIRIALIGDIPADVIPALLRDQVQWLVSDDPDAAAALFDRPDIKDLHEAALRKGPSEAWMERALLALDRGWDPKHIVYLTRFSDKVWTGEESTVWQGKIDEFRSLRRETAQPSTDPRERIIAAGIAYFEQMRDEAAKRERRERVFGRESKG